MNSTMTTTTMTTTATITTIATITATIKFKLTNNGIKAASPAPINPKAIE